MQQTLVFPIGILFSFLYEIIFLKLDTKNEAENIMIL